MSHDETIKNAIHILSFCLRRLNSRETIKTVELLRELLLGHIESLQNRGLLDLHELDLIDHSLNTLECDLDEKTKEWSK